MKGMAHVLYQSFMLSLTIIAYVVRFVHADLLYLLSSPGCLLRNLLTIC